MVRADDSLVVGASSPACERTRFSIDSILEDIHLEISTTMVAQAVLRGLASTFLGNQISIVYTPHRVGSTKLFDRLCESRFSSGADLSDIQSVPPTMAHFTVKCHSGELGLDEVRDCIRRPFQRVLTLVRPFDEICISEYFHNISNPDSSFHFGTRDEVLNASTQTLAEHFCGIDWNSYPQLQPRKNATAIAEYCGIDYQEDFLDSTPPAFRVYHGAARDGELMVAVAQMDVISRRDTFREFINALGLPVQTQPKKRVVSCPSLSTHRWCRDKQRELTQHANVVEFLNNIRASGC
ncbi:hypothetical protein RSSM_02076 [Rhodopirellula sallentina SM41]|uniref:Uncharacterized protein n=1 Tax=Rhodopirellula sallentina SM41 TaxID=1263870 RepID=M5U4W0_9BACT|nr:hypothetical protein RSSM_02076 [Rhodopirellula sallentina SM41]